jgi:acyl-CoA thioester hydrolase
MDYKIELEVRDNEIDIQGVVNNANYFIYMAHARHKFLKEILNIDFIEMAKMNLNLFLISSNIEFKKPLLPNDKFYVSCKLYLQGKIRFVFEQEIRLVSNNSLIATGLNVGVCMDSNKNRPFIPDSITKYISSLNLID